MQHPRRAFTGFTSVRSLPLPVALLVGSLGLPAVGCDPGWHYRATPGTPVRVEGLRYDVPATGNLKVRVSASAFTGSLHVELTLMNVGSSPLELRSPKLEVRDTRNTELPARSSIRLTCPIVRDVMTIPSAEACTFAGTFAIKPLVSGSMWPRDNPDMARIVIALSVDDPKPFPDISIPMAWIR